MKIEFDIPPTVDRDRLVHHVKELARIVEIDHIYFDPWGETVVVNRLISAGFESVRVIKELATFPVQTAKAEWPKASA